MNIKSEIKNIIVRCIRLINSVSGGEKYCNKNSVRCNENIRSINYKYATSGVDTPSCCNTHLFLILKNVVKELDSEGIEYFGMFGTFLGAVRHKGFIPWDTDVDLIIFREDKKAILRILEKMDFYVEVFDDVIKVNYSTKNTVHVDLFIWDVHDESKFYSKYEDLFFKKEDIFPLRTISMYGEDIKFPFKDKILYDFYGQDVLDVAYKKWSYQPEKKIKLQEKVVAKISVEKYSS